MSARESRLSRLWAHEKASYGLRVFIALSVAMGVCWHLDQLPALPGVFLGIIASAIAETDDNWWGRTKSVALSLLCFVVAAAAVVELFAWPWLFIAALALSTFGLTLLGALGERYASIAQATVTLAIYTMIGLEQHGADDRAQAITAVSHLLAGALWYGLLSILWTALFANRPVRERLARLYLELGRYLQLKADLFEPVRDADVQKRQLALAEQNRRVVEALNIAKTAILARFGRSGRPGVQSGLYLRLYYMAQDFHERASSSHYPYGALTDAFFHSDVLYRCQRLLALQGEACANLGTAIRMRRPFQYGDRTRQATADLTDSSPGCAPSTIPSGSACSPRWNCSATTCRASNAACPKPPSPNPPWTTSIPACATPTPIPCAKWACASASSSHPARCCSATACAWRLR